MSFADLTPDRQLFVQKYVETGDPVKAAACLGELRALAECRDEDGFIRGQLMHAGRKTLLLPDIQNAIIEIEESILNEIGVTKWWIAGELKKVVENASKDSDKLKAIELIMKWMNLFKPSTAQEIIEGVAYTMSIPKPVGALIERNQ